MQTHFVQKSSAVLSQSSETDRDRVNSDLTEYPPNRFVFLLSIFFFFFFYFSLAVRRSNQRRRDTEVLTDGGLWNSWFKNIPHSAVCATLLRFLNLDNNKIVTTFFNNMKNFDFQNFDDISNKTRALVLNVDQQRDIAVQVSKGKCIYIARFL